MEWLKRLFGERYDPEKDETVQALNAAAEDHRKKAEAAARRRHYLSQRMVPPPSNGDRQVQ